MSDLHHLLKYTGPDECRSYYSMRCRAVIRHLYGETKDPKAALHILEEMRLNSEVPILWRANFYSFQAKLGPRWSPDWAVYCRESWDLAQELRVMFEAQGGYPHKMEKWISKLEEVALKTLRAFSAPEAQVRALSYREPQSEEALKIQVPSSIVEGESLEGKYRGIAGPGVRKDFGEEFGAFTARQEAREQFEQTLQRAYPDRPLEVLLFEADLWKELDEDLADRKQELDLFTKSLGGRRTSFVETLDVESVSDLYGYLRQQGF